MSYRQFMYFSRATSELTDDDLRGILEEARRLNADHAITGLLLYAGMHFIQCIEGQNDAIEQLIANIRRDGRNEEFTPMIDREISARGFPAWTMGFRTMSPAELEGEPGFMNVLSEGDLRKIEYSDSLIFDAMQRFYAQNTGYSVF